MEIKVAPESDQYSVHRPWEKQTQSKPYTDWGLAGGKENSKRSLLIGKGGDYTKYALIIEIAQEILANQRTGKQKIQN